jgi:pyruvate dehydrogenase E2 component (dihydrolipoamide acetyltransferase)
MLDSGQRSKVFVLGSASKVFVLGSAMTTNGSQQAVTPNGGRLKEGGRTDIPKDLVKELELLGIAPGTYDFRPLDGLRKVIARRMVESVNLAPHFSLNIKVEVDDLLALRAQVNTGAMVRVSVNDLLIKAAAMTLMRCPELNTSFTSKGIITHHHADIAFAVAMKGGLVTPIVRQAETKSPHKISEETADLSARGRIKRLLPMEYSGGSFSVSNLGMFGISSFGAIINQPQSGILSVGAAEKTHVFDKDEPRVATVIHATLTCDHRVVDGAVGAKWLQIFKGFVEAPGLLMP